MEVDATIKKVFIAFLAKQGITVEFSAALKPLYDSTDHFLDDCDILGISASHIFSKAFAWETSKVCDLQIWEYHNQIWQEYLKEGRPNRGTTHARI